MELAGSGGSGGNGGNGGGAAFSVPDSLAAQRALEHYFNAERLQRTMVALQGHNLKRSILHGSRIGALASPLSPLSTNV